MSNRNQVILYVDGATAKWEHGEFNEKTKEWDADEWLTTDNARNRTVALTLEEVEAISSLYKLLQDTGRIR